MTDTKTIVCPHCGEALELPLGMESRNFQCPYCEMKFKLADCENKSLSSDLPMCKNESSQQKYQPRSSNDLPSRDALNFGGQLLTIKERANFACRRWQARIIDLAITGILYTILN